MNNQVAPEKNKTPDSSQINGKDQNTEFEPSAIRDINEKDFNKMEKDTIDQEHSSKLDSGDHNSRTRLMQVNKTEYVPEESHVMDRSSDTLLTERKKLKRGISALDV